MITEKVGNLLTATDVDVIVHQANLFHTFGAGIAAIIRKMYPEAYAADCQTVKGDPKRLGTYSHARCIDAGGKVRTIVNLYSQSGLGGQDRQTSYDAMVVGMTALRDKLEASQAGRKFVVGMPYRIGSGLANGSWPVVRAIIEDVWGKSPIQVVIYTLPEMVGK
jgi:O-acetyl-ADP-ribose deacetylase (regulator of RNase III)